MSDTESGRQSRPVEATVGLVAMQAPVIPEKTLLFSGAVAALAKQYGIEELTMELSPSYGYRSDIPYAQRVRGNLRVFYSAKDGRGRPRYKLHVTASTEVTALLLDEQDSSS